MAAVTPVKAERLRRLAEMLARAARRAARRAGSASTWSAWSLPAARRPRRRARAGGGLMGFARTCSVALVGVEGVVVEVQADLEPGVAAFTLVGLPDKSLIGEPGPGPGRRGQLRGRVAAEEAHGGPQPRPPCPRAAAGFDLAVACAVLGAARADRPRAPSPTS